MIANLILQAKPPCYTNVHSFILCISSTVMCYVHQKLSDCSLINFFMNWLQWPNIGNNNLRCMSYKHVIFESLCVMFDVLPGEQRSERNPISDPTFTDPDHSTQTYLIWEPRCRKLPPSRAFHNITSSWSKDTRFDLPDSESTCTSLFRSIF